MNNKTTNILIKLTNAATKKIKTLLSIKKNKNKKLRIYIVGGGCNGFQYKFMLDEKINKDDIIIKKNINLLIDSVSSQYLIGSSIDYIENLEGSRFTIKNPNATNTCSCGNSFNIY
ncbi:MAG: iron-sulfur cluster insertion protein ErpA [Candidatus Westeberhardia cardiocondylae]|nr:iron-sulfur cluster insertion protein ErpA [Candidatus Westeberhardia cardiocondylae]